MIFSKKSLLVKSFLFIFFFAGLFFISPNTSHAAEKTWIGCNTNLWSNAACWSPSGVPANGDNVTIGSYSHMDLPGGRTLGNVTVYNNATLDIDDLLTITNFGVNAGSTLLLHSGKGFASVKVTGTAGIDGTFGGGGGYALRAGIPSPFYFPNGGTLGGSGTIASAVTIGAGNFTMAATGLTMNSGFTNNGAITNIGAVNILAISGTGTWTQGSGSTLNTCNSTNAFTATASNNVVNYTSSGCSVQGVGYNTLKINATGSGATLAGNIPSLSKLYIGDLVSNALFDDGGKTITAGSASLTFTSGIYRVKASTMPTFASYTIASGTTVDYNANGNQTITPLVSPGYANLWLSGSGTKTAGGAIIARGDFLNSAGVSYDAGTYSPTPTLSVAGNFTNSGAVVARSGTVTLNPSNASVSVIFYAPIAFNNLTLLAPAGTPKLFYFTSSNANAIQILGKFTADGSPAGLISLRPSISAPTTKWFINPSFGSKSVSYLDVSYGGCTALTPAISPANSVDNFVSGLSTNDACWFPATITVSPASLTTTEVTGAGGVNQSVNPTFTITLSKTSPLSVTIPLSVVATPGQPVPATARITVPANAFIPANTLSTTVTVTTVNDQTNNDTQFSTIQTGAAQQSAGGVFAGVPVADVPVTSNDDDLGVATNVNGWLWEADGSDSNSANDEGVGWGSMNCLTGKAGGGSICGAHDYGVNITVSGNMGTFSGQAWSDTVGWIDFEQTSGCPTSLPSPLLPCQPQVDFNTGKVTGWARALSMIGGAGDGWIELSGTNHVSPDPNLANTSSPDYGMQGVTFNRTTKKFIGFGWNAGVGSGGLGWVKFWDVNYTGTIPAQISTTCSSSPSGTVYVGTPVTWSLTAPINGTAPYHYAWSGEGIVTPAADAPSVTATYTTTGPKQAFVTVTDSAGGSVNPTCTITADPSPTPPPTPLSVTDCEANPTSPILNLPMNWVAIQHGGSGSYSYSWSGDGITTTGANPNYDDPSPQVTYTSLSPSPQKTVSVTVTDNVTHETGNRSCSATVKEAFVGTCPNKSVIMTSSGLSVPFSWVVSIPTDNLRAPVPPALPPHCDYSWEIVTGRNPIPSLTNP
ncbi:MAG: hypothetical protein PHV93_05095, partial [Candidatus Pacebacteria bacterium]|nr:hypothetical protein [Candidatus Paceibacterota bacterium]